MSSERGEGRCASRRGQETAGVPPRIPPQDRPSGPLGTGRRVLASCRDEADAVALVLEDAEVCPCAPRGPRKFARCDALKSLGSSDPPLTLADVTAFAFSCLEPTEFLGSLSAA